MELRVLEYFLAVARKESITAAAEALHVTQPTLSVQLKGLEDELGKKLFIRGVKGSRRVVLTEDGIILRKRAEEILELVRKAENEITAGSEDIVGDVYIGCGESENIRLLARAVSALKGKGAEIKLNILSGNAESVFSALDKGLIDFGIVYEDFDKRKYESIPLLSDDEWGVLMR